MTGQGLRPQKSIDSAHRCSDESACRAANWPPPQPAIGPVAPSNRLGAPPHRAAFGSSPVRDQVGQLAPLALLTTVALLATLACACCGKQDRLSAGAPSVQQARHSGPSLLAAPHVTLVAVTDWQATLKPCGCTLDSQNGGVERIGRWLADLRKVDDSVVTVHAGSLLHDDQGLTLAGKPQQLALRQATFGQVLEQLGVVAVALSQWDVQHGGAAVVAAYAAAKFAVLGAGSPQITNVKPHLLIRTASGVAVGLLGVDAVAGQDDAARQAQVVAAVAQLRQQGAQVTVALANLGLRSARRLARAVPTLDVVVVGGLEEKTEQLNDAEREGDTLIVHSTRHGALAAAVTLVPAGLVQGPWREAGEYLAGAADDLQTRREALAKHLQRVTTEATVATQRALPFYQAQLADLDRRIALARQVAGQPLPAGRLAAFRSAVLHSTAPIDSTVEQLVKTYDDAVAKSAEKDQKAPQAPAVGQAGYVGQAVCLACHAPTAAFIAKDLHSRAWKTLQDGSKTKDLDCVPCHVTGFGQPGGTTLSHLGELTAVQCEACHGPGSLHVAAPAKGLKSSLTPIAASTCLGCHTPQHAPRFEFDAYRSRLKVPGHGLPVVGK